MIIQEISAPPQSGKTTVLTALAKGYESMGFPVLVVQPTREMASGYLQHTRLVNVKVISAIDLTEDLIRPVHRNIFRKASIVLLDEIQAMPADTLSRVKELMDNEVDSAMPKAIFYTKVPKVELSLMVRINNAIGNALNQFFAYLSK